MGAFIVVVIDPFVQVVLQRLDGFMDFSAERHLIKLLQDGFMEPLTDTVGLGRLYLCPGVFDVVDGQEQLIVVCVGATTIFPAAIREDPKPG